MSAPKEILKLVDQFDRNLPSLKSGAYNETRLVYELYGLTEDEIKIVEESA